MPNVINAVLYGVDVVGIDRGTEIQVLSIPEAKPNEFFDDWYVPSEGGPIIKVGGTYPLVD